MPQILGGPKGLNDTLHSAYTTALNRAKTKIMRAKWLGPPLKTNIGKPEENG